MFFLPPGTHPFKATSTATCLEVYPDNSSRCVVYLVSTSICCCLSLQHHCHHSIYLLSSYYVPFMNISYA